MAVRIWDERHRALMAWLSLPGDDLMGKGKGLRVPKTKSALARKLGVTLDTLYDWQNMPGWNDAMIVEAERTFKGLTPRFLTTLAAGLLKPGTPGYDRLVQANVRYVSPTIQEHEDNGVWERILPETTQSDNKELIYRRGIERMEQLPLEERKKFMDIWGDVHNEVVSNGDNLLTERPTIQVKRMTTEYEDAMEIEMEAEENGEYILDLPAALRNTDIVSTSHYGNVTTTPELQSSTPPLRTSTGKYRPGRKSKRSYM